MSNVWQIQPNHADHIGLYRENYLEQMFKEEAVIAQPKYDGERMLVHFVGPNVYCTSRRISKKTNEFMRNEDRLPYLKDAYVSAPHWSYTVIDCECYAKNWSEAASVLHSLPERAAELQKNINIKFAAFDCLVFNGIDVRNQPYKNRLIMTNTVVNTFNYEAMHLVDFIDDTLHPSSYDKCTLIDNISQAQRAMQNAIDAGFEGIVLKSLYRSYYDKGASLKCKKFETVDLVVCDYNMGTGKYSNTVGALIVGYYDNGKIVPVARVNCGTDADRDMWRDNWDTLKGTVLEVKCQEITGKSLRHPVYVRQRLDKNPAECTKETIFKEEV